MPRTRLAPSPTGALHLGNARTFLVNWALARQRGWQVVLRIEDLDGPRIKQSAAEDAIEILRWLGIDWDEGPHYQLADLTPYRDALERLADAGEIYPCRCTRKEIEQASLAAPHGDGHELRYPGTCRPADVGPAESALLDQRDVAWRLRVPAGETQFVDQFAGRLSFDGAATVGDFLVATKEALPSYQLAVVVDDARQSIDRVVRGDDLLSSTPRQMLLQQRLGLPAVEYWHLPLVIGEDGRRLAKRHGDTRIGHYRESGVSAERIVALLAKWCGGERADELSAAEFVERFEIDRLPRQPITFTAAAEAWLLGA